MFAFDVSNPPVELVSAFRSGPDEMATAECLNDHAAFLLKFPGEDIQGMRGRISVYTRIVFELMPTGAIVRFLANFYDQPMNPYGAEMFLDPNGKRDREILDALVKQNVFYALFYDRETLAFLLGKKVTLTQPTIAHSIETALLLSKAHNQLIGPQNLDFKRAKSEWISILEGQGD